VGYGLVRFGLARKFETTPLWGVRWGSPPSADEIGVRGMDGHAWAGLGLVWIGSVGHGVARYGQDRQGLARKIETTPYRVSARGSRDRLNGSGMVQNGSVWSG